MRRLGRVSAAAIVVLSLLYGAVLVGLATTRAQDLPIVPAMGP